MWCDNTTLRRWTTNSIKKSNLSTFGIDLTDVEVVDMEMYMCNHCVNHYGLDICECGSGETIDECNCGSSMAREKFGESVPFIPKFI